jgi:predicted MPP superfamily phosphohydrolase
VVRDIVSLGYKIPAVVMIIASLLYIGFGIYKGTVIRVTPLTISSNLIQQEQKIVFISDIHVDSLHSR